jgi:diguanylate cyclase (GGDEF)-like protein
MLHDLLVTEANAASLIQESTHTIHSDLKVAEVADFFHKNDQTEFLPVVEHKKILGIVWRKDLMDVLAGRFGRDLNQKKHIRKVMDTSPIIVDADLPLVSLSHLITEFHGQHRGDAFLIERDGHYLGAATFVDLLRRMTLLQVQSARYANPLSGLPGNLPIQQKLSKMLALNAVFSIVYVDLDHFKAYNDYYSFEEGDEAIRILSSILTELPIRTDDFVGHIGGDDFMLILADADRYSDYCQHILRVFREKVMALYSKEDQNRGGIHARNRQGDAQFFPIMSLSLGVLVVHPDHVDHLQRLATLATQAKKKAKQMGGNTFAVMETHCCQDDVLETL